MEIHDPFVCHSSNMSANPLIKTRSMRRKTYYKCDIVKENLMFVDSLC